MTDEQLERRIEAHNFRIAALMSLCESQNAFARSLTVYAAMVCCQLSLRGQALSFSIKKMICKAIHNAG